MSKYTISQLHEGTRISGRPAWHYSQADLAQLEAQGYYFPNGPVPERVARELVCWEPTVWAQDVLVNPNTMESYALPDRLRTIVARPGHGIINIAGDGYNANLHNVMIDNLEAAMAGGYTIEAAVCLGDGDFLGMTLIPTDDEVIKTNGSTFRTRLAMVSSLTGKIGTGLVETTTRGECDNTIAAQNRNAVTRMFTKRTRNSDAAVTEALIAERFEIAFTATKQVAMEEERMGNIGLSDADVAAIFDLWQPLVNADGTDKDGRGLTLATDTRGTLSSLMLTDPRSVGGQNVASLLNAHNTWQHWNQTAKGQQDRFARQMERTATGQVAALDQQFMALIAQVVPEVSKVLVSA